MLRSGKLTFCENIRQLNDFCKRLRVFVVLALMHLESFETCCYPAADIWASISHHKTFRPCDGEVLLGLFDHGRPRLSALTDHAEFAHNTFRVMRAVVKAIKAEAKAIDQLALHRRMKPLDIGTGEKSLSYAGLVRNQNQPKPRFFKCKKWFQNKMMIMVIRIWVCSC